MNKKNVFAYLLLLLLSASCNHVYKEYDKESFSTYSWDDGQEIYFTPKIEDINKTYELSVSLRHHFALNLASFAINIRIIAPSGKESNKNHTLQIKDALNKNIGSCAGDMCDLDMIVFNNLIFEEAGEYKVLIKHNERGYRIPGILEFGVIIDEKN